MSKDSGKGLMSSALALMVIERFAEVIWNDFKVTRSENSGNGEFLPGLGRPGKSGTERNH